MIDRQPFAEAIQKPKHANLVLRLGRFLARLFVILVVGILKRAIYCAWYLTFFILCMFRPFTGMAMVAAVVMVPLSVAAFVKPETQGGMPFWAFIVMTFGFVGYAIGYTIFLDWITPPGAADPFARYRRSDG
jgi:hypothetical protein